MTSILPFETARSIAETEPDEPDYVVEQLLIRGAITSLSAKIKAGKTTFLGALLHGIFHSHDVIGLRTRQARVIYCTEEGRRTFKAFLARTGLEDRDDLEVLFLGKVPRELSWDLIAQNVAARVLETKAELVIFDTFTRWAKLRPEAENDAASAAIVMAHLDIFRTAGCAVVVVFHERKSGGDVGDSMRGSSAYGGAADILVQLIPTDTNGHPNRRRLTSVGRFDDPGEWIIDWEDGEYLLRSTDGSQNIEARLIKDKILTVLAAHSGLNLDSLAAAIPIRADNGTFTRTLRHMATDGLIVRSGSGRRGDGYHYSLPVLIET